MSIKNTFQLIERIKSCQTGFDPNADHAHGTLQPQKVVFLPVELAEEIVEFLKRK